MTERDSRTDGGSAVAPNSGTTASGSTDYLDTEVNLLRPSTPFMRDHLRVIWAMFLAWAVVVFGPVTATYLATDFMTSTTVLGFPLHYFLTAVGAPSGALVLSLVYAWTRDRLDTKYNIDHSTTTSETETGATVADGGVDE